MQIKKPRQGLSTSGGILSQPALFALRQVPFWSKSTNNRFCYAKLRLSTALHRNRFRLTSRKTKKSRLARLLLFALVPRAGIESTWLTPVRQARTTVSVIHIPNVFAISLNFLLPLAVLKCFSLILANVLFSSSSVYIR